MELSRVKIERGNTERASLTRIGKWSSTRLGATAPCRARPAASRYPRKSSMADENSLLDTAYRQHVLIEGRGGQDIRQERPDSSNGMAKPSTGSWGGTGGR